MQKLQFYDYSLYPVYQVIDHPHELDDETLQLQRYWRRRHAQRLASAINGNDKDEHAIVAKWFWFKPYVVLVTTRPDGMDDYSQMTTHVDETWG